MTVLELIKELERVEDKTKQVYSKYVDDLGYIRRDKLDVLTEDDVKVTLF